MISPDRDQRIGKVMLDLQNISLSFGGVKALTDISFNVREHEIRAIIGPNGAGKSSMLNVINGVYTPQQGAIEFEDKRSEEHTSELQSLMRNSYAVFCLKQTQTNTKCETYIKSNR